ncbi:glypican-5-like isoform 4-T5 [Spinachia spinachia]
MFPAAFQNVDMLWVIVFYFVFLPGTGCGSAEGDSCHEVKTAYMMRQIGPVELVPDRPGADDSLRVCVHSGPSCCTSKMEDSYMAAVRSETQQKMRSYSFELKYLIAGQTKAFRETFESLVSFTSNLTSTLFDSAYSALASDCRPLVFQLFSDIKRHISGNSNSTLDNSVRQFYNNLFPLVYRRLLNPGIGRMSPKTYSSPNHDDCLRMTRQDVSPFGPHPRLLVRSLSRALGVGRALSRLLALAGEVVNAAEKVTLSRECGRGLVRMQYCPHCRGMTTLRPCTGLCVNIMRGCLVGVSELGAPWGSLVVLLQRLAATLATSSNHNSMELALLAVRNQVNDGILHAQLHGPRITATVEKVCGPQAAGPKMQTANPATAHISFLSTFPSVTLQRSNKTFAPSVGPAARQRLRPQSRSYAGRVVGSSFKAQKENPELTVRNTDPVLKGAKQRLEQLTQPTRISSISPVRAAPAKEKGSAPPRSFGDSRIQWYFSFTLPSDLLPTLSL